MATNKFLVIQISQLFALVKYFQFFRIDLNGIYSKYSVSRIWAAGINVGVLLVEVILKSLNVFSKLL